MVWNNADDVKLGSLQVSHVWLGSYHVWPPSIAPTITKTEYFVTVDDVPSECTWEEFKQLQFVVRATRVDTYSDGSTVTYTPYDGSTGNRYVKGSIEWYSTGVDYATGLSVSGPFEDGTVVYTPTTTGTPPQDITFRVKGRAVDNDNTLQTETDWVEVTIKVTSEPTGYFLYFYPDGTEKTINFTTSGTQTVQIISYYGYANGTKTRADLRVGQTVNSQDFYDITSVLETTIDGLPGWEYTVEFTGGDPEFAGQFNFIQKDINTGLEIVENMITLICTHTDLTPTFKNTQCFAQGQSCNENNMYLTSGTPQTVTLYLSSYNSQYEGTTWISNTYSPVHISYDPKMDSYITVTHTSVRLGPGLTELEGDPNAEKFVFAYNGATYTGSFDYEIRNEYEDGTWENKEPSVVHIYIQQNTTTETYYYTVYSDYEDADVYFDGNKMEGSITNGEYVIGIEDGDPYYNVTLKNGTLPQSTTSVHFGDNLFWYSSEQEVFPASGGSCSPDQNSCYVTTTTYNEPDGGRVNKDSSVTLNCKASDSNDYGFTITNTPDWVTISSDSKSVTVTENTTTSERSGTVTITLSDGSTTTYDISQEASEDTPQPEAYTYTVYSDCEGATVYFDGENVGTISDGVFTTSIQEGKENYTVTIEGGTPPENDYTYVPKGHFAEVEASGGDPDLINTSIWYKKSYSTPTDSATVSRDDSVTIRAKESQTSGSMTYTITHVAASWGTISLDGQSIHVEQNTTTTERFCDVDVTFHHTESDYTSDSVRMTLTQKAKSLTINTVGFYYDEDNPRYTGGSTGQEYVGYDMWIESQFPVASDVSVSIQLRGGSSSAGGTMNETVTFRINSGSSQSNTKTFWSVAGSTPDYINASGSPSSDDTYSYKYSI